MKLRYLALVLGLALASSVSAHAQTPVVICTQVVTSGGGANCGPAVALLDNAQGTTVKAVKATGGALAMLQCYNPNSSQVYVQLFNVIAASVTLGSTVPVLSIAIAPTSTGGMVMAGPGIGFNTAISLAVTTTATGSTAPSTAADCNVAFN